MADTTDTEVTVHVDARRLPDFYEWFGRWLGAGDDVVTVPKSLAVPPAGRAWNVEADDAAATSVVRALGAPQRELLALLSDQPDVPVGWSSIVARCGGSSARDVAQFVADIAVVAAAQDRVCPVRWFDGGAGATYWLPRDAAPMWIYALAPPEPVTATGTPIGVEDATPSPSPAEP